MLTNKKTYEILSAINKMDESRSGGWIHNCKLNLGAFTLVELMDKKFIEPGGTYSRLTKYGTKLANTHDMQQKQGQQFLRGGTFKSTTAPYSSV